MRDHGVVTAGINVVVCVSVRVVHCNRLGKSCRTIVDRKARRISRLINRRTYLGLGIVTVVYELFRAFRDKWQQFGPFACPELFEASRYGSISDTGLYKESSASCSFLVKQGNEVLIVDGPRL